MVDSRENLLCPACGKDLIKVYKKDVGVYIDICADGCGGIYFDNRELEKFDESSENADEIFATLADKEFEKTDETQERICPVCKVPMVKIGAGSGGVTLDCCYTCGAKFLDNGELQKMRTGKKDSLDSELLDFIDVALEKNIEDLTFGNRPATPSPRRLAVERFILRYIYNK